MPEDTAAGIVAAAALPAPHAAQKALVSFNVAPQDLQKAIALSLSIVFLLRFAHSAFTSF
jgi:hypothetical protein